MRLNAAENAINKYNRSHPNLKIESKDINMSVLPRNYRNGSHQGEKEPSTLQQQHQQKQHHDQDLPKNPSEKELLKDYYEEIRSKMGAGSFSSDDDEYNNNDNSKSKPSYRKLSKSAQNRKFINADTRYATREHGNSTRYPPDLEEDGLVDENGIHVEDRKSLNIKNTGFFLF